MLLANLMVSHAGAAPTSPDFVRDVRPILEKHCFQCHGPEKQKSGLRLDLKYYALKGGDAGKVIDYGVRFTKPVVVDPAEGAVVTVTGKIGEINADAGEVRVDLTVIFNETAVLGKAQARVRL